MSPRPPDTARAVIVGGGVSGASVAYHLAKLGWHDVVLLERKRLTGGTTWHAAGLIGQLRASANLTRLAKYSAELYGRLEAETGIATGYRRTGSITLALTPDRAVEIGRQAALARSFGVAVEEISPQEARARYPHLEVGDATAAVFLPGDGQGDPGNIALALVRGAKAGGVTILEDVEATGVVTRDGRVAGLSWRDADGEAGTIATEVVVNCAGLWARELARQAGVTVPLHACEHFYIVTEPIEGLGQLPVLRVPDECAYYKEDAGKLLVGAFEPVAKPWGGAGIPADFCFDQLPDDWDHFAPVLERASSRLPILERAGIRTFFNGPESFTPDNRYHLGEAPELAGYFVAAGYNSIGIASSGGAGMALAHWIADGEPPFDLWDVDIRRTARFQRNRRYLAARVTETLGLLYADHWPHRQPATARGLRRTPLHGLLASRGAVFGEVAGWERANWYAQGGEPAAYAYGWQRPNWWHAQAREHRAVREGVGLFDLSSFGKIRVEGRDALALLQRVCTADVDIEPGRIAYAPMLNARGGIEADVTVARLSPTAFLVVTPAATLRRDLAWIRRHIGTDSFAVATDMTAAEGVLGVFGPRARDVLAALSPDDLSAAALPYGAWREIEIGMALARVHRVSFTGELGFELYVPAEMTAHVGEVMLDAGDAFGLVPCGLHAFDSLRLEKAFRHYGHDISDEDHLVDAGLGWTAALGKGDFIGRDAVLKRREAGPERRLLQFLLDDPEATLFGHERLFRDGEPVSWLTSGGHGHTLGAGIGLGYVPASGRSADEVLAAAYAVEVGGRLVPASASLRPLYDPAGTRMRG